MKRENIVRRLEKEGYKITLGNYSYWQVPCVGNTALAETYACNGSLGVNTDLRYADVISAIEGKFNSVGDYLLYCKEGIDMRQNDEEENK